VYTVVSHHIERVIRTLMIVMMLFAFEYVIGDISRGGLLAWGCLRKHRQIATQRLSHSAIPMLVIQNEDGMSLERCDW
jgi:hypothetical protein